LPDMPNNLWKHILNQAMKRIVKANNIVFRNDNFNLYI